MGSTMIFNGREYNQKQFEREVERTNRQAHQKKLEILNDVIQSERTPHECWGCVFRILDFYCLLLMEDHSDYKDKPRCTITDWTMKLLEEM